MALFFFLSGYTFHFSEDFKSFVQKRVRGLLIPYVFFAVVISLYTWLSAVTHNNTFSLGKAFVAYIIQTRYTHLWFLPCLFLAEIGTWVVYYIYIYISKQQSERGHGRLLWLWISIIQLALFFLYRFLIGIDAPWNADLSLLGMGFMSLGIWYKVEAEKNILKNGISLPGFLIICSAYFSLSSFVFVTSESVDWYSNRFGNPILFIVVAILGVFTTVLFSQRIHWRFLTYIGANSIVWYGLHRIVIDATFILYNKLHITIQRGSVLSVVLAVLSVAIATMLLIPVNILLNRFCPFLIGKKKKRSNTL